MNYKNIVKGEYSMKNTFCQNEMINNENTNYLILLFKMINMVLK